MTLSPRTWTLTDGHAGNVRQAAALAHALALPARDWTLQTRVPWKQLAPRLLPGSDSAFGPQFQAALAHAPALAIGCGRQAALATRVLGLHGARTIQILDPRVRPRHWDLVIAPDHDGLRGPNVLTLLGSLHPVDGAWLADARHRFPQLGALPGPRTALLVGGPSAHASLEVSDIQRICMTVDPAVQREDGTLMIATSRRTPAAVVAMLRQRYAGTRHLLWCDDGDGANPYAGLLGWAGRIVCTADSVNMLSEACATHAPVFVPAPERVHGRPQRFLRALLARGRIQALDEELDPFEVVPLRETARVAAQVRQRLSLA
jgi:mitochondrial fission protein ELM1